MTGGTSAFRATVLGATLDELGRVTAALSDAVAERDRLRAALQQATLRLGILRNRAEACHEWSKAHPLDLLEVPVWIEEAREVLAETAAADGGSGG